MSLITATNSDWKGQNTGKHKSPSFPGNYIRIQFVCIANSQCQNWGVRIGVSDVLLSYKKLDFVTHRRPANGQVSFTNIDFPLAITCI